MMGLADDAQAAGIKPLTMTDPMELLVRDALQKAGILFFEGGHHKNPAGLDFYLSDFDVYIECKQFHSERITEQMSRAPNVIALQGRKAVELFVSALKRWAVMPDGSRYLQCECCDAVFDRRPDTDFKTGGAYRYGSEHELRRDATAAGWRIDGDKHYCPRHASA
jgi:hypothetical protein